MPDLGRVLQEAGLNEPALAQLFGPASSGDDVPLVLSRYSGDDPRSALVRLFVLGETVDPASLPIPAADLVEAGLVELGSAGAVALVRLTPHAGFLITHDPDTTGEDTVTGVNAAARTLATLTVRRQVERALDLGTGSGVQALLASRHARTVVATDVNTHALELAALGARLNGTWLDLRAGSLYDPVGDERFDLIVANPPFVISPDHDFVFRDSGQPGDAMCRDVVRGAAAHLHEGGFATVLCNWVCRTPEERWEPLLEWVDGLECDALLISHGAVPPLRYASRWNEPLRGDPDVFAAAVGRWLDYYEAEGIAGIGIGAVILRGRAGAGWVRGFTAPQPALGSASDHILRLFAAADRLGDADDVLDGRFELVPGHRLDQTLVFRDDYEVTSVTMSLAEGTGLVGQIDPAALPLVFALTPEQTVRELAVESEVDQTAAAAVVRQLYERGLLERRDA